MKHRHRLAQAQRHKAALPSKAPELEENEELQAAKAKKKHGGAIHAPRAKHHLGKRGRATGGRLGQTSRRFDSGGAAGSTRTADDPGGEIASATRDRKSTAGRISDELFGPKSAYARGGRQKHHGYDAGGATGPGLSDFSTLAQPNPITRYVQRALPPTQQYARAMQARAVTPTSLPSNRPIGAAGNKKGGRVEHQHRRHFDDGGIADASPPDRPPSLTAMALRRRRGSVTMGRLWRQHLRVPTTQVF
jgi:hypothetical protein